MLAEVLAFVTFAAIALTACNQNQTKVVGVQPLGSFDQTLLDSISDVIESQFRAKAVILPGKVLPRDAFVNVKTPRFRADKLIRLLKAQKADTINYIIGLTQVDISTTVRTTTGGIKNPGSKYEDWGIFGLGYRPGPSCIVSTFRLGDKNEEAYLSRITKVVIHELGHNMGLDHCKTERCVMMDAAEKIKTIDMVDLQFCSLCRSQI